MKAEIERYNELCAAGKDTDFGKPENLLIPIERRVRSFVAPRQDNDKLYRPG